MLNDLHFTASLILLIISKLSSTKHIPKVEKIVDKIRIRGLLSYNIKKWKLDPSIAAEYFARENDEGTQYNKDKMRYTISTKYKIIMLA